MRNPCGFSPTRRVRASPKPTACPMRLPETGLHLDLGRTAATSRSTQTAAGPGQALQRLVRHHSCSTSMCSDLLNNQLPSHYDFTSQLRRAGVPPAGGQRARNGIFGRWAGQQRGAAGAQRWPIWRCATSTPARLALRCLAACWSRCTRPTAAVRDIFVDRLLRQLLTPAAALCPTVR